MAPTTSPEQRAKKEQAPPPTQKVNTLPAQKKIHRRSSKPIINWFQRKLTGTAKAKRVDTSSHKASGPPLSTSRSTNRIVSPPLPSPGLAGGNTARHQSVAGQRKTISLNGDEGIPHSSEEEDEGSLVDSNWSRTEADEDASLRPIPPSSPPSPSPSRSSSSYVSHPRTFRSIAASTKPTTLLSIDLNGGMAHIAQAPAPTPTRLSPHIRTSSATSGILGSGGSTTFSALPPSVGQNSHRSAIATTSAISSVQAPLHTTHHPRNNPRPSSPPNDDASVLTLASSAFAFGRPVSRAGTSFLGGNSAPPSAMDSISHFGGSLNYADAESTSQFVMGDDDRLDERDVDASVRALRPRSSRRGSWESEVSRWSAREGGNSLARERSVWTTNSVSLDPDHSDAPSPLDTVQSAIPACTDRLSPLPLTQPTTPSLTSKVPIPALQAESIVPLLEHMVATGDTSSQPANEGQDTPLPTPNIVLPLSPRASESGAVPQATEDSPKTAEVREHTQSESAVASKDENVEGASHPVSSTAVAGLLT